MFLHAFSSPDLSCHSGPQHHTGKQLGFPSDSILIYQGDEEQSFLKHMQCCMCFLSVFLLFYYVYISPSRKLVQAFSGAKGKGEVYELHLFQKETMQNAAQIARRAERGIW